MKPRRDNTNPQRRLSPKANAFLDKLIRIEGRPAGSILERLIIDEYNRVRK